VFSQQVVLEDIIPIVSERILLTPVHASFEDLVEFHLFYHVQGLLFYLVCESI